MEEDPHDKDGDNVVASPASNAAAYAAFLALFEANANSVHNVIGHWEAIGGLPPALSAKSPWGNKFAGDATHIKIDARTITTSQDKVLADIHSACELTGCDERVAILIARAESNFRADAQSPGSSAAGVNQITAGTAQDIINRILPRTLPHTAEGERVLAELRESYNPYDSRQNTILGAAYIKYNHDKISSILGHQAEAWQDYMMHFNPVTAEEIARNPDAMDHLLPADVRAANPAFRNMTAGQLADVFRGKMSVDVSDLMRRADGSDPAAMAAILVSPPAAGNGGGANSFATTMSDLKQWTANLVASATGEQSSDIAPASVTPIARINGGGGKNIASLKGGAHSGETQHPAVTGSNLGGSKPAPVSAMA